MTKKIVRTERFEENLYQLQKQNKEQAAFLAEVRQLAARARMDMICGSRRRVVALGAPLFDGIYDHGLRYFPVLQNHCT